MADIATQKLTAAHWSVITDLEDGKTYYFQNTGRASLRVVATDGPEPSAADGEIIEPSNWTTQPIQKDAAETIWGFGRTQIFKREVAV